MRRLLSAAARNLAEGARFCVVRASASPLRTLKVGFFLLFAIVKLASAWRHTPVITGDGRIWARIAEHSVFSGKFWTANRPPTLSLAYKLIGNSDERLVWFQSLLALTSWGLLATATAELVPGTALSLLIFVALLGVGLSTPVQGWDTVVRSESIAISTFVLCVGAAVHLIRLGPSSRAARINAWMGACILAGALSAFARETNSYALPLLGLLVIGGSATLRVGLGRTRLTGALSMSRSLVLAAALVLVALGSQANTRASHRYAFPLMNVIFKRILPERKALAYFRSTLGMPVSDALLSRRGRWASSDRREAFRSPELKSFRTWLRDSGYAGYQRYLLSHPVETVTAAARYFPMYTSDRFERLDRLSAGAPSRYADRLLVRGPHGEHPWIALALCGCLALFAAWAGSPGVRALALAVLMFAACALSQAYICFHADAMELDRHGLMVGLTFRLAVVLAPLAALTAWRERRAAAICRTAH